MSSFKAVFKYYKSRNPQPSLDDVLDLRKREAPVIEIKPDLLFRNKCFGLRDVKHWKVYELTGHPRLIIIKNAFTNAGQRYWICRCLNDFTKKPNKTNMDPFNLLEAHEEWWDTCSREASSPRGKQLLEKLRWVTLGYHHNWDTKVYSEENKGEFPEDLAYLCEQVGDVLGFSKFRAEAAIINMYHMGSTLSPHTDHSEVNVEAPLFSFSFGQSAVFLIGGKSIEVPPTAILLESGDICVMAGASRLCYHAVPLILKTNTTDWSNTEDIPDSDSILFDPELIKNIDCQQFWLPFEKYVKHSRINMNVRQVLHDGEMELCRPPADFDQR